MKEKILLLLQTRPWTIAGLGMGFLLALLLMIIGFWRTLLLALLCGAGVYLGSLKDRGRSIIDAMLSLWMKVRAFWKRF